MSELPPDAIHPNTRAAWRAWLVKHHASSPGVWLISYKKATGMARFEYDEAVQEALCVGWVDSKPRKLDDARSMLWFAPRKTGTGWSKQNKERVARLLATGAMLQAGLAKVEAAKRDGSWARLDAVEALELPLDLVVAMKRHPPAAKHFEAFPRSVKRSILEWIVQAKRAETRAKRVDETAMLAARNERANQWRK